MRKLLSFCIPTHGVSEWVVPVLESIYSQTNEKNIESFEVIITDNGNNLDFKDSINAFLKKYDNIFYFKTDAYEFLNEIESYKRANGSFIKFINHRTKLNEGALDYFINFVKSNLAEKPFVYFSNGVLKQKNKQIICNDFDSFVSVLSYWSSWSTGMGFWKDDAQSILEKKSFNVLYPHTDILFCQRRKKKYIIDDSALLTEIPQGKKPKGKFNLFFAFAVEYPSILCDLLRSGDIQLETFLKIKKENFDFICYWFYQYNVLKRYCSYDLSSAKESFNVYYKYSNVKYKVLCLFCKSIRNKFLRLVGIKLK